MNTVLRGFSVLLALGLLGYGLATTSGRADAIWLLCLAGSGALAAFATWPRHPRGLPIFNRTLLRWTTLLVVVFGLVSVQLVRVQIVESNRTINRVEVTDSGEVVQNPRHRAGDAEPARGRVLDASGSILAETVALADGRVRRSYPEPAAWGLVGYYSPLLYGSSQVELAYDDYLSGQEGGNPFTEWLDEVLHRTRPGYDIQLSIDLELQRLAAELLGQQRGAAILMNAETGEVLAMAGQPSFDPNQLYAADGQVSAEEIAAVQGYWAGLTTDPSAPLVFRPTLGLYTPGSTFKTVTASAAIDTGTATPETIYRDEGVLEVDGRIIIEQNRPDENRVDWSLEEGYAWSLNVVFAQIGLQLGGEVLWDYAGRFGFGEEVPFDLPSSVSQLADEQADLSSRTLVADTAFGQGEIVVTPLQMALVAAAVANGGEIPEPRLVTQVLERDGEVLERFGEQTWRKAISENSAEQMRRLMVASVEYGYASGAQIPGVIVGGKTGTAETGTGEPHAWFIGFAEADDQRYVVAVVVENGGSGSQVALPIGRALLESTLNR
jgi:peptidoglycan glycosyltransferase